MQPSGNGPFYIPGVANCPAQSFRFESRGGYTPISWSLPLEYQNKKERFLLVDPSGQTGTTPAPTTLPFKAASPSTRLLRALPVCAGCTTIVMVQAVDGSGQKREILVHEIRLTNACAAPPVLSGASSSATTANVSSHRRYTLQVANFYNSDQWGALETRVECGYPSGFTFACDDGLLQLNVGRFWSKSCSSFTTCEINVLNLEGSGPVAVRLRNPYSVSAVLMLNITFPSTVRTQNEAFVLPSTIEKEPAIVTGTPGLVGYMGEAAPTCSKETVTPDGYFVWRGMTYPDPSGRATLDRPVKVGARVMPSTIPQ